MIVQELNERVNVCGRRFEDDAICRVARVRRVLLHSRTRHPRTQNGWMSVEEDDGVVSAVRVLCDSVVVPQIVKSARS